MAEPCVLSFNPHGSVVGLPYNSWLNQLPKRPMAWATSNAGAALYVIWYTAGRTWIEMLRIDFSHEILGLRVNVWVSICVFIAGVIAFIVIQRVGQSADRMLGAI